MKNIITILTAFLILSIRSMAQIPGISDYLNTFSFDIYKEINHPDKNVFISPLSTYLALSIAYEGAKSTTKKEFENVLQIGDQALFKKLIEYASSFSTAKTKGNYLSIANAIWIKDKSNIDKSFIKLIQDQYSADVKSVDFYDKTNVVSEINNWVSNKTNKQIKEIVTPNEINDLTQIIISNAIYFIANWEAKFDKEQTKPDKFYTIEKSKVKIDFMNKTEFLRYFENDKFQFISKRFENKDKSFCVILPKDRYGLNKIEDEINQTSFEFILNNLGYSKVKLSIPKFTMDTNYDLKEPFIRLGLEKAFTNNADFSDISKDTPLMINEIKHKAYIQIDEEKTEATAATMVGMMTGSVGGQPPKTNIFKADHPFIFMILDNKTNMILFIGRFVNPD